MALGVSLSNMVDDLRAELGKSLNAAHGVNERDTLKHRLRRAQETLWTEANWPHLMGGVAVDLTAGAYLYNYPAEMAFDGVNTVWSQENGHWRPVTFGIDMYAYSVFDSAAGETSDPVRRWRHAAETNQIEVWPCPASNQTGGLVLEGKKALNAFVGDADTCTLDHNLIVLRAAAAMLARKSEGDAQIVLAEAERLKKDLLAQGGSRKTKPFVIGGGPNSNRRRLRPGIDYIP